ncbi:6-phosphogluconolactonase [Rubrobacter xylanophilus DSM 9941]|uniref:6-phosphogluconolactonase n=1 Tax=Rubrobacter xylanophilus TaxID=49319 RepID=UPI001C63C689|nr:6-phosphogluconolactonase [Rubrobacter xylanophilus]QYJ16255.1 6-phosphogluconolactonase [Rubrobacter xylanophilus DSM 9941]
MTLRVLEDPARLAAAAAREFAARAARAIRERGRFAVALAGGSTPRAAYELLARDYADGVDWGRVHFFFGDERPVPPDHADSNHRMAREALLSRVPAGSVHRMRGELAPEEAARRYEEELRSFFAGEEVPRFDLILLGLGEDGHTASLFPHTRALGETERLVVANPVERLGTVRITLTPPVINAARAVVFLVAGGGKADALREVLEGSADPRQYPAKLIRPGDGEPLWLVDRAAAASLGKGPGRTGGWRESS